jgi:hypothetical protein
LVDVLFAEQVVSCDPSEHVHFHLFAFAGSTAAGLGDGAQTVQRFVFGAEVKLWSLAVPQLGGVGVSPPVPGVWTATSISDALESSPIAFVQMSRYVERPLPSAFLINVPFATWPGRENLTPPSASWINAHPTAPVVSQVKVSDSFGAGLVSETRNDETTALAGATTISVPLFSSVFQAPPIVPLQFTL